MDTKGHHWLERHDEGGVTVVRVTAPRLRGEEASREVFPLLYALVDQAGRSRLVLDLARVASVDSWSVGGLVLLNRKAQAAGGRLALCNVRPEVRHALEVMHLSGVLESYPGEEQAAGALTGVSGCRACPAGGTAPAG